MRKEAATVEDGVLWLGWVLGQLLRKPTLKWKLHGGGLSQKTLKTHTWNGREECRALQ